METGSFVDLIKKFGNENANNFERNSSSQNINLDSIYPYGQFPIEKTKGYDPLKNKKNQVETLGINNKDDNKKDNIPKTNNNPLGNLDLKTILPLMSSIKNKNKLSTYDLFNLIMPTMYKDNPNMKEIIKYFAKNDEPPKSKLPPSKMQAIDSYVKA